MASTYDRRQPPYMSEGRLSRVKSGSTGTLYRQSRMSNTYNTSHGYSRLQVTRDEDYIYAWCHHYGLTPATARVLSINGIENSDDLLALDRQTVSNLAIKDNEKLLFRGALLQFKQSDYQTARKQASKGLRPVLIDKNHGISEEERQKRLELRTRLRRKKIQNNGGLSLADRILMQRRDANSSLSEPPVGTFSLPSIDQSDMVSSRSLRSYTDPTPRRISIASKTSDYSSGSGFDSTETPQKVVKKKKEQKRADSSGDEEEKTLKKKNKKKKKVESESDSEVEAKPKKSKKKKDKVNSDSNDEDREEVKKKKKKKKKSKDNDSENDEETEKKSKKKKGIYDEDESDEDAGEIKKKKKKDKKKKDDIESDADDIKREKKKKKKDKEKDLDSDVDEKEKKKKKKKDKDVEPSESEDEETKREKKKKKKKKKKERDDSDDD